MRAVKERSSAEYELLTTEKTMDGTTYFCYGIRLSYAGTEVCVEDISLDKTAVMELVEKCNRLQLSPIHFREVLEDFLEN